MVGDTSIIFPSTPWATGQVENGVGAGDGVEGEAQSKA